MSSFALSVDFLLQWRMNSCVQIRVIVGKDVHEDSNILRVWAYEKTKHTPTPTSIHIRSKCLWLGRIFLWDGTCIYFLNHYTRHAEKSSDGCDTEREHLFIWQLMSNRLANYHQPNIVACFGNFFYPIPTNKR